ncbi:MAG TPA: type II toxin-antitoxin system PemK/MazF family toxin [Vicinamibacterales bacterium]|nr:type II toxin-antitoxin system PemK/MazF family toxin [Vicinamibacterales bacterium]
MRRGELYRVAKPADDAKRFRVFVVVSRQVLIDSHFSTVVCAPVHTTRYGLSTEVPVGPDEGLRHESSVHCDALVSLSKSRLTQFVGTVPPSKIPALDRALSAALGISPV